jgi:predicted alternative tryptophan synthase beta-subunit
VSRGDQLAFHIKVIRNSHTTQTLRRSILDLKNTRRSQVPTAHLAGGKQCISTEYDGRLLSPSEIGIAEDMEQRIKNEGKKKKKRSGLSITFVLL